MYTFKTIIDDFERPLKTTLEDSIHMPQNHNNRNRRRPRKYAEHKHGNNAGVVQAGNGAQATGVVPPEQRRVAPTMTSTGEGDASGSGSGCPEVTYSYVPEEGFRRNRPTATMDARVRGEERGEQGKFPDAEHHETWQHPSGEKSMYTTPQHSPTRVMFGKLPRRPDYKTRVSSPILDEVLMLRAEVQDKILEDIGDDNEDVAQDKRKAERQKGSRVEEVREVEEPTRPKTPALIPDMGVSDENWAQPLYELASSEQSSKRASREVDPIDALSDAMEELRVFQEIGSSSRGDTAKIMTTPVVDLGLSPGSSGVEGAKAQEKEAVSSIPSVSSKESFKSLSLKSVSSDDFEKVHKPMAAESEENGGRRKWYKGFRR